MSLIRAWPGHALGDPLFAAAQLAPILPGPLQRQSRIGDLPQAFITHLRKPALKRLCLGRRDGLDQPENSRDVPALEPLHSPLRFKGKRKGGDKLSPPFEGLGQRGIAASQLLQVIGGSGRIRQRADDVGEDKPPLRIVKNPAHWPFFEKGHIAHLPGALGRLRDHLFDKPTAKPYYSVMRYAWDPAKDARNQSKHGLSLADGIPALEDPDRNSWIDNRFDYGEIRIVTAGRGGGEFLIVVSTEMNLTEKGEEIIRIISVRKAKWYEEDWFDLHGA